MLTKDYVHYKLFVYT